MHSGFSDLRKNLPMKIIERLYGKSFPEEVWKDIQRIESIWKDCLNLYQGPFYSEKNLQSPTHFTLRLWEDSSHTE